jgi:hypothetical protein
MKYISPYHGWLPLYENTAAAKQYVIKQAAERLSKEVSELTDSERARALDSPQVQLIFSLTKDYPSYSASFLRFYFEHNAPIETPADNPEAYSLEKMINILKTRKQLISQLPHNFDYYASLKPERRITGWERLTDSLRTLERAKEAKWFVDSLPRPLRDGYRALPTEEQAAVITLAIKLKELGKEVTARLFEKIKAFSSWTISDVISYASNYVKGYSNLDMRKKIDEIESLAPEAGIIYSDDQYVVVSIRTEASQKELCAIANWCINRGRFAEYSEEAVQLNIFNFGADPTDPLFLTGTTVYYSGKVRTSHDINDDYIQKSQDPAKHFLALGYPKELVSAVMVQFPIEASIKKIVYDLKLDTKSPEDLLFGLIRESYRSDYASDPRVMEIIGQIIDIRVREKMSRVQVVQLYVKYGVLSKFSAQILKSLVVDPTKTEMQQILSSTLNAFKRVHAAVAMYKDDARIPIQIKNVLSREGEVLAELGYSDLK